MEKRLDKSKRNFLMQGNDICRVLLPISLLGSVYKITVKLLAERLNPMIGKLVSDNQNLIGGRQVVDAPISVNGILGEE